MKYNIISVTDTRDHYKEHIRKTVQAFEEAHIPSIDARKVHLRDEMDKRGLWIPEYAFYSIGEVGIWLSVFDCWQWAVDNNEPLIVFEDDARPRHYFDEAVGFFMEEIPDDWDFLVMWVPDNQKTDYTYDVTYDENGHPHFNGYTTQSMYDIGAKYLAKVYNGYGNVCQIFSPKGAQVFIDRAREAGMYSPVDCFQYLEAHKGNVQGYAPKPYHATVVDYDWPETTVHTTERFNEVYP